jgi:hypothetical protein
VHCNKQYNNICEKSATIKNNDGSSSRGHCDDVIIIKSRDGSDKLVFG